MTRLAVFLMMTTLSTTAFAGSPPDAQSESALQKEAGHVLWLMEKSKGVAIECKDDKGFAITVKAGINGEDNSGLIVTGDYSYGTDQIQELYASDSLVLTWGEEGNYTLVIPQYSWLLFNYSFEDQPSINPDATASGMVMIEQDKSQAVVCRVN